MIIMLKRTAIFILRGKDKYNIINKINDISKFYIDNILDNFVDKY